jgi:PAS domain S-box-containing protein
MDERTFEIASEAMEQNDDCELKGAIDGAVHATEDLRDRLEVLTKETVELQKVIIERFPDSVVVVNDLGAITHVNQQTVYMFGYHHSELIGQKVEILLPHAIRDLHIKHRERFADDPRTRQMGTDLQLLGRRKNGSEFPVEIMLSPIVTITGSYAVAVIRRKRPDNR